MRVDMDTDPQAKKQGPRRDRSKKPAWRRFARSRDGAAAIEFAILAFPYFLVVFAILETFIAFIGEQVLSNGVEVMARKLRTGEIRYPATDRTAFRTAFCNEISLVIKCTPEEIATPTLLYLDVRSFNTFADIPTTIPRQSTAPYSDLKTTDFAYSPGGKSSINMLRAYYRWQVMTDLVRPYITTIRPADGSMPRDFLIVATATFQNEAYP